MADCPKHKTPLVQDRRDMEDYCPRCAQPRRPDPRHKKGWQK